MNIDNNKAEFALNEIKRLNQRIDDKNRQILLLNTQLDSSYKNGYEAGRVSVLSRRVSVITGKHYITDEAYID